MRVWLLLGATLLAQIEPAPLSDWVASDPAHARQQRIVVLEAERGIQRVDRTALVTVGAGTETHFWRNTRWQLEPNRTYAFRVRVKGEGSGGCAIVGANTVNRDFIPHSDWHSVQYVFRTPADTRETFIRVGHWHWRGEILFDQPQLLPVEIVHAKDGTITLGDGETIRKGRYRFATRYEGELSNASAPLQEFTATFNTNRWVFAPDTYVTYRHALGGLLLQRAVLNLSVCYEQEGALTVLMRKQGGEWQSVQVVRGLGDHTIEVPSVLLPTRALEVRLVGRQGVIQVDRYELEAELAQASPPELQGRSLVLYPHQQRGEVQVKPLCLQRDAQGNWSLIVEATCRGQATLQVRPFHQMMQGITTPTPLGEKPIPLALNQPTRVAIPLPAARANPTEWGVGLIDARGRILWGVRIALTVHFLDWSHYGYRVAGAPAWAGLWWCEWGWKVGRTRALPTQVRPAVQLRAARGEYEPVQIVLRPTKPLRLLKAEFSPLTSGRDRLAPQHLSLRTVAYVPVQYPTDSLGRPDEYPDPLPPLDLPLDIPAGQNQPLWLTVYVPYGTPAKVYKGVLTLQTNRGAVEVPLELTVYDFELPRTPTLRSGFGISAERIFQYHRPRTDAEKQAIWDRYMQAFRRARLAPYHFSLRSYAVRLEEGQVKLDFSAFDRDAQRYLDGYGFNSFVLPIYGLPSGRHPNYAPGEFLGFKEGTPEYERYWTDYMHQLQEHLRSRGWLRKAYIYWFDEPEEADYPFVRRVNERIKRAAPDLTIMLTEQPEEALVGTVDLWCPLTALVPLEAIRARRAAGEEVWWYVCTGPRAPYATLFIDHPGTEMRVWLWQTWKYGVQGILIWETTYWHNPFAYPDRLQDPWIDPMSYVWDASFAPGTRQFWGNGDGRLFYPPRRDPNASNESIIADPIPSLRWECLRDGAEDYEYFVLLEQWVREAERKRVDAKLLQRARALLHVPSTVVKSMTEFTFDPRSLDAHRERVARMIEALQAAVRGQRK